jgi:hypothetical protein
VSARRASALDVLPAHEDNGEIKNGEAASPAAPAVPHLRRQAARRRAGGPRSSERHAARPALDARLPLHVTIRAQPGLRLRRRVGWRALRRALEVTCRRHDFRICHVSVQATHIHLIVEADSHVALARGMQRFQIYCARQFDAQV